MICRVHLLILVLHLSLLMEHVLSGCPDGFNSDLKECLDFDECDVEEDPDYPDEVIPICGENASCFNTNGSYYCQCESGFRSQSQNIHFTADSSEKCKDINECFEEKDICGPNAQCHNIAGTYTCTCNEGFSPSNGLEVFHYDQGVTCEDRNECELDNTICEQNAKCINTPGNYHCVCDSGFVTKTGKTNFTKNEGPCENVCVIDKSVCGNGTCHSEDGGLRCACHAGFTNYGNRQSKCTELKCNTFTSESKLVKALPDLQNVLTQLSNSCLELSESEEPRGVDGKALLERLFSMIDRLLSGGPLNDNRKVTALLVLVEQAVRMIGPLLQNPQFRRSYTHTEVELLVQRNAVPPLGPLTLSSDYTQLDSHWEMAAGEPSSYPGFATVSLITYKGLENSINDYFKGMRAQEGERFQINSKVVTATVSNMDTAVLEKPVTLTFSHLEESNEGNYTCVYWDTELGNGAWSDHGCVLVESNASFTMCSCNHLSSFAVLMALYEIKDQFQLQLITWVGLSLSLLCLLLCILTFSLCRSIQSTRNTIHLHLCISLFIANLIFLFGISRTENQVGCAVVASLLHFFFLAAFCWMCLEGVQLFRMVVLVFNTTFRPLYMIAGGYGVPAIIVTISAIANSKGYGTKHHCWLNLNDGFIWSFFGPVCVIIMVNILFFLITVWKLAQKFSSLNPDLNNLRKIKAFTITAVAQLCVLGTMWIFGCFQFDESTLAMSYLFTILNSLQGVLLFLMHCLLNKQVREEYGKFLSSFYVPQKKYSDFSSNQTSKSQTSKSAQNTGESQI